MAEHGEPLMRAKTAAISAKLALLMRSVRIPLSPAWFDLLQDFENARPALDRIVEMKNQMRRVFQNDFSSTARLQNGAIRFQLRDDRFGIPLPRTLT